MSKGALNRNLLVACIGEGALLVALIVFLVINRSALITQLELQHSMLSRTEAQAEQLQKEKAAIFKDNEKLQVDTLSYLTLNNELQQQKEALNIKVQEVQKAIEAQKLDLAAAQQNLAQVQKMSQDKNNDQKLLMAERDKMQADLRAMEASVNRERGIYHYNLAVAYTKAGIVNKAVQEYNKSLEYDPRNAEAYYNLGVLYKNLGNDSAKALTYFRMYLEIKPDAEDAQQVRDFIYSLMELSNRKASS